MKKNWYDRNLGSQSKAGKTARKVTDLVGARGIRQAAGDRAAGRKVNKRALTGGVANLALTVSGGAGLGRAIAKRVAAKGVAKSVTKRTVGKRKLDPIKDWKKVQEKRQTGNQISSHKDYRGKYWR